MKLLTYTKDSFILVVKVNGVLSLQSFTVTIDTTSVVNTILLTVLPGHHIVIQGKNGSGKSSLLNALAGHPFYKLTAQEFMYKNINLLDLSALERAQAGLFLVPQHSPALPGVALSTFLKESFRGLCPLLSLDIYQERLTYALSFMNLSHDFITKPVHEHFSGGEKKRCEMLQLMVLQPSLILLDELDSGLDKEGIELFIKMLAWYKTIMPDSIFIIVTHSPLIADQLPLDKRYVMDKGHLYEAT